MYIISNTMTQLEYLTRNVNLGSNKLAIRTHKHPQESRGSLLRVCCEEDKKMEALRILTWGSMQFILTIPNLDKDLEVAFLGLLSTRGLSICCDKKEPPVLPAANKIA